VPKYLGVLNEKHIPITITPSKKKTEIKRTISHLRKN